MILGPLFITSFLPIWTVWYFKKWEATGVSGGTLWSMLRVLPANVNATGFSMMSLYGGDLVKVIIAVVLGIAAERFVVLRRRRAFA